MVTVIYTGLAVGAIYALVALQYDIVYTATGLFNFAQASFVVLGSFLLYALMPGQGVPVALAVPVAAIACAAAALLQDVLTIRPLLRSGQRGTHPELVTTLGVASILEGFALLVWGSEPLGVDFPGSQTPVTIFGGNALPVEIAVLVAAIVITLLVRLGLRKTPIGLLALATARDRELAMLRGIDVRRVSASAFAIAGALAGLTAILVAPVTFASYSGGQPLIVGAFAALAIGGFGTEWGALVGGLVVGVVQSVSGYLLTADAGQLVVLGVLLAVLLLSPAGLFGSSKLRVV